MCVLKEVFNNYTDSFFTKKQKTNVCTHIKEVRYAPVGPFHELTVAGAFAM